MAGPRLQLVWSTDAQDEAMLRVAFASTDRERVNQHFGSAEAFVIHEISCSGSALAGFGVFAAEAMDGNEDKLISRFDFLEGCHAVFVLAVGASAIKQLLARGIQPIRIAEEDSIPRLIEQLSVSLNTGGVAWIERALQAKPKSSERFAAMEAEGWEA